MTTTPPPVPRYRLTVVIEGNTLDEVADELHVVDVNFWAIDVHGYTNGPRDEFDIIGGRSSRRLEHRNPEMTPERYADELTAWGKERRTEVSR